MTVTLATLDDLAAALRLEFARDPTGVGAAALLERYAALGRDWRPYTLFHPGAYTRNLVDRTADYELLLLCWDEGQQSPIHNHEGQNCWMVVLEGPIEEQHYPFPDNGASGGPLHPCGPVRTFAMGEVAFIRDEIALHVVRAPEQRRGVSLHLYARPFASCNCYCEHTGRVSRRELTYDSVRGVPRA